MPSSNASLNCRIDWRPAPLLIAALALLGPLAAVAVLASALPLSLAWPLAAAVFVYGSWLSWREWRRPATCIVLSASDAGVAVTLDARPARLQRVNLRGGVAVMVLECDGHRRCFTWCPLTLDPDTRRTFRLLKRPGGLSPTALPLVAG